MAELRDAVLVRRWGLRFGLDLLLRIGRKVKIGQVFLVVTGIDDMGLMTAKLRAIKQEPEEDQVGNDRDPNSFTTQSTGTLVFEPVNQVKEFVRFQLLVAHALTSGERLRWTTGRAGWDFG